MAVHVVICFFEHVVKVVDSVCSAIKIEGIFKPLAVLANSVYDSLDINRHSSTADHLLENGYVVDRATSFTIIYTHKNPRLFKFTEGSAVILERPFLCKQKGANNTVEIMVKKRGGGACRIKS